MICRICNKKLKQFKKTKKYERYKCVNKNCEAFGICIYYAIPFEFPKSNITKKINKFTAPKSLKIKTIDWLLCK